MKTPPAALSVRYPLALILAASAMALPSSAGGPSAAVTATGLKSFEGVEEPKVRYIVAGDRFEPDDFVNIADVGDKTVRMTLRYRADAWWDGDRTTKSKDRQRAEVKGLGPHQKEG